MVDATNRRRSSQIGFHIQIQRISCWADYRQYLDTGALEFARQSQYEQGLLSNDERFTVHGYCYPCRQFSDFHVDYNYTSATDEHRIPNWRERLVCRRCGLNNRLRAAVHLFELLCQPRVDAPIYLTEQTTALYRLLSARFPNVTGSEYLGSACPAGTTDKGGIRNESLCALSFPDAAFDHILSFDVLEHIPDYRKGFQECLRCLRPGGSLIFSVPFLTGAEQTVQRARLDEDGKVVHLLPPEYHGDPINTLGCLCYWHFAWDLLDELRSIGFKSAEAVLYWSDVYGYLGGQQIVFMAQRNR